MNTIQEQIDKMNARLVTIHWLIDAGADNAAQLENERSDILEGISGLETELEEQQERAEAIAEILADQPEWIVEPLSGSDVAAIVQGGCASGAYMPAVTYHQALETMGAHGDDVLTYIEDATGEMPAPPKGESWAGLAVFFLSHAVELYAGSLYSELEDLELSDSEIWELDD